MLSGATVVKPVGFATGDWEGSRCGLRTRIVLQNPVAQVVVAILWGHGPFATPGQGRGDAHWVCTGLHPRDERRKPGEAPQDAPHDVLGRRDAVGGLTHCVKSRLRRELYHPQRSSETLRLACKIAPICLIPLEGGLVSGGKVSGDWGTTKVTYFRDGEAGEALRIKAEIPFTAWRGIAGLIRVGSRKLSFCISSVQAHSNLSARCSSHCKRRSISMSGSASISRSMIFEIL